MAKDLEKSSKQSDELTLYISILTNANQSLNKMISYLCRLNQILLSASQPHLSDLAIKLFDESFQEDKQFLDRITSNHKISFTTPVARYNDVKILWSNMKFEIISNEYPSDQVCVTIKSMKSNDIFAQNNGKINVFFNVLTSQNRVLSFQILKNVEHKIKALREEVKNALNKLEYSSSATDFTIIAYFIPSEYNYDAAIYHDNYANLLGEGV